MRALKECDEVQENEAIVRVDAGRSMTNISHYSRWLGDAESGWQGIWQADLESCDFINRDSR